MKGWEKIFQANGSPKQAGVPIPISDKVYFKPKLDRRDKRSINISKGNSIERANSNS
jgi:hypothetical protein